MVELPGLFLRQGPCVRLVPNVEQVVGRRRCPHSCDFLREVRYDGPDVVGHIHDDVPVEREVQHHPEVIVYLSPVLRHRDSVRGAKPLPEFSHLVGVHM